MGARLTGNTEPLWTDMKVEAEEVRNLTKGAQGVD